MSETRRDFLAAAAMAATGASGASGPAKVPLIYTTDLHHPHVDPDDHFDLAALFAIPEFDIRAIVLDDGARQEKQPGRIPLEQMMHLARRKAPYGTGLRDRLQGPGDDGRGQPAEFQRGVELILDALRGSREKVTLFTTGSLRDVAAALNRDPALFAEKAARLYINIGDSGGPKEYNVGLDVHAWVRVMRSGLPVYWCPCHDGGAHTRGRGYATWWQFRQHELLLDLAPGLRNYFVYALTREESDPLGFLARSVSRAEAFSAFHLPGPHSRRRQRAMWCTAPLLHAAGREVEGFTFVPVRAAVDDAGAAAVDFNRSGAGKDMLLFKLVEPKAYDEIMTRELRELLESLGTGRRAARAPRLAPEEEWRRTGPDAALYLPRGGDARDGDNEVVCVLPAPRSDELLALWTQSSVEGHGDNRLMLARSSDGVNWSAPAMVAGTTPGTKEPQASWGIPIVSRSGRIYCMYLREAPRAGNNRQESGELGCASSDDNGRTWTVAPPVSLPRDRFDHPDRSIPVNWWSWAFGVRDRRGRYLLGYTRCTSHAVRPKVSNKWMHADSRCAFVRFENLDEGPDPRDLKITWLPRDSPGLAAQDPLYPDRSVAQEPGLTLLPDGRLMTAMRTMTGSIYYSVSDDDGDTWRKPEPLRYRDGGLPVLTPVAPCPIFSLADGRYLLLFHNNDGERGWCSQWKKEWRENEANYLRHPAYLAVGEFRPGARQPVWFSPPRQLFTSGGVIAGPKRSAEVATYASLTEWHGRRTLWYPDRKHYLLGKHIPDAWLEGLRP